MIKKLKLTFLVIIPLLFLVAGLQFDRTKYGTDPESAYLLNGMNIAMGKSVGHYDNPGTTVQIYSAVMLKATHFFRFSGLDLQTDVLTHSEYYIEILRKGLIFINACAILILGLFAVSLLKNSWAGLVLQLAPFLSVTLMEECFTKIAPEQLLFTTVAILIILLLKFYTSSSPGKLKFSLLFGLLAGFGLATKMTYLPLLIIPFVVLQGQKNKWVYVASILPSFILFTLPAVKGYPQMAYWFLNLGTHTGTYGQGASGILDPATYIRSILEIAGNNVAMLLVMFLSISVLLTAIFISGRLKSALANKEFSMLLALLSAQVGSVLMVAKHYHNNHYLFPALSLTAFVLVFIILLINKYVPVQKLDKFRRLSFPVLAAVILGVSLLNIPYMALAFQGYRLSNQSTDETFARLDHDYKGYTKVYYYPASFNEYSSLRWGNVYSRQYSTEKLMKLYPDALFYNAWDKSFQWWETNIPIREFVKKYGGRILLVGGPRTDEELKMVEQGGLKLNKLFESRVQAVYEIDTTNSALFRDNVHTGPPVWSLQNDFETMDPDGQWILASDGSPFCKNIALVSSKSRSGKYAFELPVIDSYAMEYLLQDVKPGFSYEFSIWKTTGNPAACLVASGGDADPFYQQSTGYVETDSRGWEKVILGFKIPAGFKGNKLKIYLWNHGSSPVWFDDFKVEKFQ